MSTSTFNGGFTNLAGGSVVLASGDLFRTGASFNAEDGTDWATWNTQDATLEFFKGTRNTTNTHAVYYSAADLGAVNTPMLPVSNPSHVQNGAWGTVQIDANQILNTTGVALYTTVLSFPGASTTTAVAAQVAQFTGPMNIYYVSASNPGLGGLTYPFASGSTGAVIPV